MKNSILFMKNEKGFGSLILVMVIAGVASLMIIQMSVSFQANRIQHRKTAFKSRAHRHLQGLAQKVKRSIDMAELDPTCASAGAGFSPLTLNGSTAANPKILCIPSSNEICVTDERMFGDTTPICANVSVNAFNWRALPTGRSGSPGSPIAFSAVTGTPDVGQTFGAPSRRNRIQVPGLGSNVWKSCTGTANCIRLEMCPAGERSCTDPDDIVTQVIRIGL